MSGRQPGQRTNNRVSGAWSPRAAEAEAREHRHLPPGEWGEPLCWKFPSQLDEDPSGELALAIARAALAITRGGNPAPDIVYSCSHSGARGREAVPVAHVFRTSEGILIRQASIDWHLAEVDPSMLWHGNGFIALVTSPQGFEQLASFPYRCKRCGPVVIPRSRVLYDLSTGASGLRRILNSGSEVL